MNEFLKFMERTIKGFSKDAARKTLRRHLQYKTGHVISKKGNRKRTSVNVYMSEADVLTLRPPLPFAAPLPPASD